MRKILPAATMLLLAGCGGSTAIPTIPVPSAAAPVRSAPAVLRGPLIGLDTGTLLTRFGQPRLRVREGDGTKLQFAGGICLLDAYLYPPPGGGAPRVTHVDTRNRDGRGVDQAGCVASLERR